MSRPARCARPQCGCAKPIQSTSTSACQCGVKCGRGAACRGLEGAARAQRGRSEAQRRYSEGAARIQRVGMHIRMWMGEPQQRTKSPTPDSPESVASASRGGDARHGRGCARVVGFTACLYPGCDSRMPFQQKIMGTPCTSTHVTPTQQPSSAATHRGHFTHRCHFTRWGHFTHQGHFTHHHRSCPTPTRLHVCAVSNLLRTARAQLAREAVHLRECARDKKRCSGRSSPWVGAW